MDNFKKIIKVLLKSIAWLLLLLLLFVAIEFKSPYLLPYRAYELPVLLLLCGILWIVYFRKISGVLKILSTLIVLGVFSLVLVGEYSFGRNKRAVLNEQMPDAQLLGSHFVIGYRDIEELKPLVSRGLIGGIFITQRNVAGKSIEEVQQEIAQLQQLRIDAGLPALIVTTDQEGGIVSHMSPPLERMPGLSSLANTEEFSREEIMRRAQAFGRRQGQALAMLGITVNFSPVVDLIPEFSDHALDFHSRIGERAISSDPTLVADVSQAYIEGLNSQGVLGTLKHFPGLGRVPNDTHHFSANLNISVEELQNSDWIPFRQVSQHNNTLIMLGHVILTSVDDTYPASFSQAVVQGIIREDWQHKGVLITDDLTMRAAYSYGLCHVAVKALNAGVDLLLISYDYEKFYDAFYCAQQAYMQGDINQAVLARSHERLKPLIWPVHLY